MLGRQARSHLIPAPRSPRPRYENGRGVLPRPPVFSVTRSRQKSRVVGVGVVHGRQSHFLLQRGKESLAVLHDPLRYVQTSGSAPVNITFRSRGHCPAKTSIRHIKTPTDRHRGFCDAVSWEHVLSLRHAVSWERTLPLSHSALSLRGRHFFGKDGACLAGNGDGIFRRGDILRHGETCTLQTRKHDFYRLGFAV